MTKIKNIYYDKHLCYHMVVQTEGGYYMVPISPARDITKDSLSIKWRGDPEYLWVVPPDVKRTLYHL